MLGLWRLRGLSAAMAEFVLQDGQGQVLVEQSVMGSVVLSESTPMVLRSGI